MDKPMPATVVQLRNMVQRLLAAGVPRHAVLDRIIGESPAHASLCQRAAYDWACHPQLLTETVLGVKVSFRNGEGSIGARRSTNGFREYLEASP